MLLSSQSFLKSLSEAHSSGSDFTSGTKTGLFSSSLLHQNSSMPRQGEPAILLPEYNYLKASAWCYRGVVFCLAGLYEIAHRKRALYIAGLICNYYIQEREAALLFETLFG